MLVLDNYQEAPLESEIHEVMRGALEEIPERSRLIFISRSEPPAAFARALAHEVVAVLDWPQLRFTPAEAGALVRARAPVRLTPATLRVLYDRTEGWCAGLILLHDQLRNGRALPGPSESTPEVLFSYFAGEIFQRADAAIQDVLMRTAFLPKMSEAMAEALTGQPRVGEMLATLHRQNYFTNKQAGNPPTYEYHPLFREFLLARARRATRARRSPRSGGRPPDSYEAGRIEAAATLLRDASDWEGLAQLIHRHGATLLGQGRGGTIEEWLGHLPAAIFEEQPWLRFWREAWAGWRGGTRNVSALEDAFVAFRRQGDTFGMYLAWAGLIYAYASDGEFLPLERWIRVFDEIKPHDTAFPSKGIETRVAAAMLVAVVCRQPGHPEAALWARRAIELARHHPDPALRTTTLFFSVHYQWMIGDFSGLDAIADEMRALLRARDSSPVVAVNASMTVVWYETAKALPSYRRTVTGMLELARTTGMFYTARHVVLSGGLVGALSDGDLATAGAWLRELERDVHLLGPGFRAWHHWFVVWEALIRKDVARAASYQPEMLRLAQAAGRPVDEAVACLMSAQTLHALGETSAAFVHVERARAIARAAGSSFLEFMVQLTEAQLALDAGRESEGLDALRAAMALGRRHGFVTSFVWIPAVMAGLCGRALEAGIEPEYVGTLIRQRGLVPDDPPLNVEAWPWPVKVYTLGRFEVLRAASRCGFRARCSANHWPCSRPSSRVADGKCAKIL